MKITPETKARNMNSLQKAVLRDRMDMVCEFLDSNLDSDISFNVVFNQCLLILQADMINQFREFGDISRKNKNRRF
jgi:hypothetical protein